MSSTVYDIAIFILQFNQMWIPDSGQTLNKDRITECGFKEVSQKDMVMKTPSRQPNQNKRSLAKLKHNMQDL